MNANTLNSVCWNITSKCNDNCKFCYRDRYSKELSFDEQIKVIDNISQSGVIKLTFAGGEPLLIPQIKELITYAKQKGLIVSITTNGILMDDEMQKFCFDNLDWISLSLEGGSNEIQTKMTRNKNHAEKVKQILNNAHKYHLRKCKIKINTIVSNINAEHIMDVADIVANNPVDRWKLFQFTPLRGTAKDYNDMFAISDNLFNKTVDEIKKYILQFNVMFACNDSDEIKNSYFVIAPNGDIRISDDTDEIIVGNALEDSISRVWEKNNYNKAKHNQRTDFVKNRILEVAK